MGDLKLITTAYDGKCRKCRAGIRKGERVWWQKGIKGVLCIDCKADTAPVPAPAPITAPEPTTRAPEAPTAHSKDGRKKIAGRTVREFGSWGEFVDYAEVHKNAREKSHIYPGFGKEWYGTETYDDAVRLARHGWDEVRPEVDALVENIDSVIAPVLMPAFTSYFDVSGGTVDIGRFMDGEPECMVETRLATIAKPGRVVSILVDGFYSESIRQDDIIARGVAIVGLVDALEKMQHSTEIWYETSFRESSDRKSGGKLTYLVKLKGADEMLDIDSLMFAIANPASFRRINFAAQERRGENREFNVGEGNYYGEPAGLQMGKYVQASIQLPRLVHGDATANGSVWVKKVLSEFGLLREENDND